MIFFMFRLLGLRSIYSFDIALLIIILILKILLKALIFGVIVVIVVEALKEAFFIFKVIVILTLILFDLNYIDRDSIILYDIFVIL